jgi:hypothetical protein
MKLKLNKSTIICLSIAGVVTSYGIQVFNSSVELNPNSQSPDRSVSMGTDRFLFMRDGKFGYIDRLNSIIPGNHGLHNI